jgi:hexulose-6-phosphate isomerase
MDEQLTRRGFLATATLVGAGAGLGLGLSQQAQAQDSFRTKLHKAQIVGEPTEANLRPLKEAGFDGVEAGVVSREKAEAARRLAEGMGLRVHSVLRGWASFNSQDPKEVDSSFEHTVSALRAAQAYGAEAILLVPGRIGDVPIPDPWDFRVQFDPATGHLAAVVEKENEKYAAYIQAHNRAHDAFLTAIRRLIPFAQETGVVVAIENVWNNLYVDPTHFAHFLDEFASPWVKAYLDLGNHLKYSATEKWIGVLGTRLAKCHVKDFRLNPDGHGGQFVTIREGNVNWPEVRQALERVGYNGWLTVEGSGEIPFAEQSRRLDLIIAGK